MERRTALQLIAVLGLPHSLLVRAQPPVAPSSAGGFAHTGSDLLLDQSGVFGKGHCVLGVLSCPEVDRALSALRDLRRETGFRCQLSYSSRNKWKLRYAQAAIDYWLNASAISIRARAIDPDAGVDGNGPAETEARHMEHLAALLNARPASPGTVRLITQARYSEGRNAAFHEALRAKGKGAADIIVNIAERQSDLMQLLGFVLGTVYGAYEKAEKPPTNPVKRQLIAHLQGGLGVKSLWSAVRHPRLALEVIGQARRG